MKYAQVTQTVDGWKWNTPSPPLVNIASKVYLLGYQPNLKIAMGIKENGWMLRCHSESEGLRCERNMKALLQRVKSWKNKYYSTDLRVSWASLVDQRTWSLDMEDPLVEEMAIHFSILPWEIPWTEEPCRLQSRRLEKIQTCLSD